MGEPLDMFGQPVGIKLLDRFDDAGMQLASPVLQQTPVG